MEGQVNFQPFSDALGKAQSILVLAPQNPSFDSVAAALGLYLTLTKMGKQAVIACPSPMTVIFNRLYGIDKIKNQIGNRNLIITLVGQREAVEKVSSNVQDKNLNLVIEPRPDGPALRPDQVQYSYSGTQADLIIIVGALKLDDLSHLYTNEKAVFEQAQTINLDYRLANTKFGKINLLDYSASSCCELLASFFKFYNVSVDQESGTDLLAGIEANTSKFQSPTISANAFEVAAWLMKNGAKKGFALTQTTRVPSIPAGQQFSAIQSIQPPFSQPTPVQPAPFQPAANQSASIFGSQNQTSPAVQPPPDWFKPKIFKSNSVI